MSPTVSPYLMKKIVTAEHPDPFGILGMHPVEGQGPGTLAVRAFLPDVREACVLPCKIEKKGKRKSTGRNERVPMERIHPDGLFEAVFPGRKTFFPYQLEAQYAEGSHRFHDPYAFGPVLSEFDMHLFAEGNHHNIYDKLGAHVLEIGGVEGVLFAVWAPNAWRMSVVGDFNHWDGRRHPMRVLGQSGIWELFIPGMQTGELYKYEIKPKEGACFVKSDPYAFFTELRPKTASVVYDVDTYKWHDKKWMNRRKKIDQLSRPMSIYEVHLGSWRRIVEEGNRSLTYREAADQLVAYVKEMSYTHIEFMPLSSHPYDPSWGYQVAGYYSATPRYGSPNDLMYLVDICHRNGIGVILDWVPAHFPTDAHALAWFDGTCLYEHADPKKGKHPDWGTLVFNYGRNEVRNFLVANALFWLEKYHIDGLRVDAVASMLYLDYSRKHGEWIPNQFGGNENLEALCFVKKLNDTVRENHPGVLMIAEESTAWPAVSRPTHLGGLGFSMKWNMGWMHDILVYMSKDPVHRKFHHNMLSFALLYTFYENFILSFSHDEVVHGKGSLLNKMPGDDWQKFANLRLLLGYMFGHPGKKLLFMGNDIGQWSEWDHNKQVAWELLEHEPHNKLQTYVKNLNQLYTAEKALHELDFNQDGFDWIDFSDTQNSVVSFVRQAADPEDFIVCIYNLTPVPRDSYRIGVPVPGFYREVINSDADTYGGSNLGNLGGIIAEEVAWHGKPCSLDVTIPPLACLMFKPEKKVKGATKRVKGET